MLGAAAATNRYTGIPPSILVRTPYRGQHAQLTQGLSEYCKGKVKASTIDAAQGQEADLVIISFVRANATGIAGFTNDAKRLNVAIARAKAGVVIIGHLATSLAASTSGFAPLLYELGKQGAIYDYHTEEEEHPMLKMTDEVFRRNEAEFPPDAADKQRRRKQEGKDRASHTDTMYDTRRAPDRSSTRWRKPEGTSSHSQGPPPSCLPCHTSAPCDNKSNITTTPLPTTLLTGIASRGPGKTSSQRQEYQLTPATSFSAPCSSRCDTPSAWSRLSTQTNRAISTTADPTVKRNGTATNARDTRSSQARQRQEWRGSQDTVR